MTTAVLSAPKFASPTWQWFRDAFRRHPTAIVGAMVLAVMVLTALLAPWLGSVDPQALAPIQRLKPPSREHWFAPTCWARRI